MECYGAVRRQDTNNSDRYRNEVVSMNNFNCMFNPPNLFGMRRNYNRNCDQNTARPPVIANSVVMNPERWARQRKRI